MRRLLLAPLLAATVGVLGISRAAPAHPVDELVQATYLTLGTDSLGVELSLTPGLQIAGRFLELVDTDRDGRLSAAEARAYAEGVVAALRLSLDGRDLALELRGMEHPATEALLRGEGAIRLRLAVPGFAAGGASARRGEHRLVYQNGHEIPSLASSWLVNAYLPEPPVAIREQTRDWYQRGIEIRYEVGAATSLRALWQGRADAFVRMLGQGVWHIFVGSDHVLFVVGLLLVPAGLVTLLKVVSAFTVAHSITLALATFGVLAPPPSLIEPLIAASIVFVGVHALRWRGGSDPRLLFAFGFGLLHGFGFAYALAEFGLSPGSLASSLLAFNLGVEIGQVCIVLLVAPALMLLRRHAPPAVSRRVLDAGSVLLILAGAFWFVERVAALV